MSLKSRLLNKNVNSTDVKHDENVVAAPPKAAATDIVNYFEMHPEYESLSIYSAGEVYVEHNGNVEPSDLTFDNDEAIKKIIDDIANQYAVMINSENPSFSIVLANKIRINAIMPPLLKEGYYLSLRRVSKSISAFDNACEEKLISSEMILFLKKCLNLKLNIFVVGEADVNKVRILNYLANMIAKDESIVTVETVPELKIQSGSVVSLMKYKSSFSKLIKKAIKLNQNRVVISDMNIAELVSLYEYIISGYSGFLTSFSIRAYDGIINALENLILLNNPNIEEKNADSLIASSMDIVVQVERTKDGAERITKVSEITKNKAELKVNDIFIWKESSSKSKKVSGNHFSTGLKSKYFNVEDYFVLGFLDSYYEKDYKHSYVGEVAKPIPARAGAKLSAETSKVKEKLDKYKKLKAKMKNSSI